MSEKFFDLRQNVSVVCEQRKIRKGRFIGSANCYYLVIYHPMPIPNDGGFRWVKGNKVTTKGVWSEAKAIRQAKAFAETHNLQCLWNVRQNDWLMPLDEVFLDETEVDKQT